MYDHQIREMADAMVAAGACTDVEKAAAALREYWGDKIVLTWSLGDVLDERPDLTPEQGVEVLENLLHNHDCSVGVSWDTIDIVCCLLFGEAPENKEDDDLEHVELLVVINRSDKVTEGQRVEALAELVNRAPSSVTEVGAGLDVLFHFALRDEADEAKEDIEDEGLDWVLAARTYPEKGATGPVQGPRVIEPDPHTELGGEG